MYSPPTLGGIHPRRFGLVSWSPHVPFGYDLVADLRPQTLVELGTHSGESYFTFCQSAEENGTGTVCYAVDTWKGDPQAGYYEEEVYQDVRRHNQQFYASFSYLVRSTFDDALDRFADGSLDLIHFDGLHTYEAVRHDFQTWRRKLSPRGVALFHDIAARHNDFGAWKCWEEIRREGASFEFRHGWGLGVWKPAGSPPAESPLLRALFSASPAQAENIRRYYAMATDALRHRMAVLAVRDREIRKEAALTGNQPMTFRGRLPEGPSPAESGEPRVQIFFPDGANGFHEGKSSEFLLTPNRWERIEVPLPANWRGESVRVDPGAGFGLVDVAGVRVVSEVMGGVVWELLGADLAAGVSLAGGVQAVPNGRVMRLLCSGEDPQILLPRIDLQGIDEPLRLEIGIRVRTEPASFGYTLQDWARELQELPALRAGNQRLRDELQQEREAHQREREAHQRAARTAEEVRSELADALPKLHAANEQAIALVREVELAHAHGDERAAALLLEVGKARTDAAQRTAAFNEQLAASQEAARLYSEQLTAEIAAARAHGDQRAATLLAEVEKARTDADQRTGAFNEQLAASQEAARRHAEKLNAEIDAARRHAEQLTAALETTRTRGEEQLAASHEAARRHAEQLTAEIAVARTDAAQRTAAFDEQRAAFQEAALRHAEKLNAEIDAARAHGDQRAATLLAEIQSARTDADQRTSAFNEQLTASQEAARLHAEQLTAEIDAAREHAEQLAAALEATRLRGEEQLAASHEAARQHAEQLAAALEATRLRGEEQLAASHEAARQHAEQLAAALEATRLRGEEQLAASHEAARQHAEQLAAEIAVARTDAAGRTAILTAEIENLHHRLIELGNAHADLEKARGDVQNLRAQLEHTEGQFLNAEAEGRELEEDQARRQQDREFLQQEVNGLHQELQVLDDTLLTTGRDLSDTRAALDALRLAGEADQGRLRSMRRSLSWKLTLPLRVLHRAVTGHRPASRAGTSSPSLPGRETLARGDGGYRFRIDGPTDWNLPAQRVRVRGWCVPPAAGRPLPILRIRCGERTAEVPCDVPRPDVQAAFKAGPEWHGCGFDTKIDVPGGPSQLTVEAVDEHGHAFLLGRYKVRAPYADRAVPIADSAEDYAAWIERYDTLSAADRRHGRAHARALPHRPLISIIMPVYNTPEQWLTRVIDSVRRQLYPFWELCIADDCSPKPHVREVLARYERMDPRIKVCHRAQNGHISAASNSALELATGEFVALLDHDDELPLHALYSVALELQDHPEADLIYSDEDKIDEEGRRFSPYFKPDWNPDLLLGQNFISHLGVYRREIVSAVGGFRVGYEGCQDWDLALRVTERIPASHIRHIPRVLYHWRAIAGSTARAVAEKDYIADASRQVLLGHCERIGADAEILSAGHHHYRVRFRLPASPPLVSIIIPTHNQLKLLRQGIESLRARTTYKPYEILVVDNRSDDPATLAYLQEIHRRGDARVLPYPQEFNYSAINNFAVGQAAGELVCLMNNDMDVITPGWLEEMASHALRPGVGAVGAILYYPDDTIQHAGVVIGLGGVAGHIFSRLPRGTDGYFNRARLVQNYSAVTAACLVIRRSTFQEVGGLDETLKVAFNDVDFCLKVQAAGYHNLWTPHAEFYHHESASRGAEDTGEKHRRFVSEVETMLARWPAVIADDPAYNRNLTATRGDCALASPPRVPRLRASALPEPAEAAAAAV